MGEGCTDYNASRGGGQAAMTRNVQTNDGRGFSSQRGYQAQDGQFHGSTSHVTNSGKAGGDRPARQPMAMGPQPIIAT
jgi:hypothetical protein